ncbi:MAG TPA: hypothetical protein VHR66_07480 [Gemmataceae bacterium]|jgi:hypothetical protein|nr:hypothetical protein [Gemmataceae bacterium]
MNDFDPIAETDVTRPNCVAGEAALQRLLDGDATWDTPEALAHRLTCVDCREELILARSLNMVPAPIVVPAGLTDTVLHAAMSSQRRRRLMRYAGVGMGLAASALVAVVLLEPPPQTIRETHAVALVPPKNDTVATKPLGASVNEARDAIVSLTKRTATETRDTSTGLIPNPKLKDMPDPGEGLEPLADARSGAARSVEPIKSSARRAMNLFLRAAEPPNRPATVR